MFARDTETGAEIARFCVLVKPDFCQDRLGTNEGALTKSVCFRRSFEQRGNPRLPDRFGCVAHEGAPLMPRGVCLHFQEIRCKKSLLFRPPQLALSTTCAAFVAPSSAFCLVNAFYMIGSVAWAPLLGLGLVCQRRHSAAAKVALRLREVDRHCATLKLSMPAILARTHSGGKRLSHLPVVLWTVAPVLVVPVRRGPLNTHTHIIIILHEQLLVYLML